MTLIEAAWPIIAKGRELELQAIDLDQEDDGRARGPG